MYKKIKAGQYRTEDYANFHFTLNNSGFYEDLTKGANYLYMEMLMVILADEDNSYGDQNGNKYIFLDEFIENYLKQEFEESCRVDLFQYNTLANLIKELEEYKLITLETSNDRTNKRIVVYLSDIDSYYCDQLIKLEINKIKNHVYNEKNSL